MGKYRITDNQTGKTVTVSGDNPPTEQEAEQIFKDAGLRGGQQSGSGNFLSGVADFLVPANKQALQNSPRLAQQTFNPPADAKGDIGKSLQVAGKNTMDLAGQAIPAGLEAAAYFVPQLRSLKGAVGTGALSGGLFGASAPAESLEERVGNTVIGTGTGAATMGLLDLGGKATNAMIKSAQGLVNNVLKPVPSKLEKFAKNTGLDFAEEVAKRDLKAIAGKGKEEIYRYYDEAWNAVEGKADEFLNATGKTEKKQTVINMIDKQIESLSKNRVGQSGGVDILTQYKNDLLTKFPDDIPLSVVNQIKRDAQEQGRAAFGPNGSSSPASNALADLQGQLNDLLETKAPGFKNQNKDIQFYHLAREAAKKLVDKKGQGALSDLLFSGGAGAAGMGLATGNIPLVLGSLAPYAVNQLRKSPKFQTSVSQKARDIGEQQLPDIVRKLLQIGATRSATQ